MFDALETRSGLDVVIWMQGLRSGVIDTLIRALDFGADKLFFIIVLGLVYWVFSRKLGLRAFYALIIISLLVFASKDLLARPRPYEVSGAVVPMITESTFGLPSGHVAISLVLWGVMALWLRNRWITFAVGVYVILQGFGRMIAGVHYPQDVVGGLILGVIVLAAYDRLADQGVSIWQQRTISQQIAIAFALPAAVALLTMAAFESEARMEDYLSVAGLGLGGSLAVIYEWHQVRFVPHPGWQKRTVQYCMGIVLCAVVLFGLDALFEAVADTGTLAGLLRITRYAIVAFIALGLWPYISLRAGLLQKAPDSVTVSSNEIDG